VSYVEKRARLDSEPRQLARARAWATDPDAHPDITAAIVVGLQGALAFCSAGTVRHPEPRS
jgi:hypothetical protein